MRIHAILAALPVVLVACVPSSKVTDTAPKNVVDLTSAQVSGPYVHAGTAFAVRIERAIDTLSTPGGTPFRAEVLTPLFASDGHLAVPAGAQVYGHLANTRHPELRLQLDEIGTVQGPAPIIASVRHVHGVEHVIPGTLGTTPQASGAEASKDPYTNTGEREPVTADSYQPDGGPDLRLLRNSRIDLVLARPLFLPGSCVVR